MALCVYEISNFRTFIKRLCPQWSHQPLVLHSSINPGSTMPLLLILLLYKLQWYLILHLIHFGCFRTVFLLGEYFAMDFTPLWSCVGVPLLVDGYHAALNRFLHTYIGNKLDTLLNVFLSKILASSEFYSIYHNFTNNF